jgi:rare lipoprotein A (peptidoglycan hydrolase)
MRPTTARQKSSRSAFGRVRRRLAESRKRTRAAVGAAGLATCAALFFAFQPAPSPDPVVLGAGEAGVRTVATAPVGVPPVEAPPAEVAPLPAAPAEPEARLHEQGEASYYGEELAGRPTASGETFDPNKLTAAHRTLPLGTRLRVTNTRNGESVVVRVNDRGPFAKHRVLDLSKGAARQIGMLRSGTARVEIELLPS